MWAMVVASLVALTIAGSSSALAATRQAPTATTAAKLVVSGPAYDLRAVSASSSSSIWAAGGNCTLEFFNGSSWSAAATPTGCSANLTGITVVSATEGYAVGAGGAIVVCTTNCTSASANWAVLSTGTAPTTNTLEAVTASGSNSVAAVGDNGTIVQCNSACTSSLSKWHRFGGSVHGGTPNLYGVAVNGDGVWYAVGAPVGGNATTLFCNSNCSSSTTDGGWAQSGGTQVATTATLYAVATDTSNAGSFKAVGSAGAVLSCGSCANQATAWSSSHSGTQDLYAVSRYATSSADWAVGANGTIFECASTCYTGADNLTTVITSPTTRNLYGVTDLSGGTSAWAVGATGAAAAGVSSSWATQPTPAVSVASGATLPTVSVQIANSSGIPVKDTGIAVTLSLNNGGSFSAGTNPESTDGNGVATFSNLVITAGHTGYVITASANDGGAISGTSGAFNVTGGGTAPVITMNPSNASVAEGQNATFTAAASGNPTPTVQWRRSNNGGATFNPITGANSDTYSFTTGAGDNGAEFDAVFTNSVSSATTSAATLMLTGFYITTTSVPDATRGVKYSYQLAATGAPTPYRWKRFSAVGTLPAGMHITSGGLLTGKPFSGDAPGTYTFVAQAKTIKTTTNPKVQTAQATLTITLH